MCDLLRKGWDPGYDRHFARRARQFADAWIGNGAQFLMWDKGDCPDLGTGELLAALALFSDWCHDYIVQEPGEYNKLQHAMYRLMTKRGIYNTLLCDAKYGKDWTTGNDDSNHMAIVYGGAGLAALALDTENGNLGWTDCQIDSIQIIRQAAASRISDYFNAAFQVDGAGTDGVWYSNYGLNVALPYALAANRIDWGENTPYRVTAQALATISQASTWLMYEELPYDVFGGTPLNDTAQAPGDLNPEWRSWPWLMALATESRPSASKGLFYAMWPADSIGAAMGRSFNETLPTALTDPLDDVAGTFWCDYSWSSFAFVLGWPRSDEAGPEAFQDPTAMSSSRYFAGRGITYFRKTLEGLPASDSTGWLATFQCLPKPNYNFGDDWCGHAQQDVNHWTVFYNGAPLVYDCGYGGHEQGHLSWYSRAHNEQMVSTDDGSTWCQFAAGARTGNPLGAVVNADISWAAGDNTQCWPSNMVEKSTRRMFVVIRPALFRPFFVIHDAMRFSANALVRSYTQTANENQDGHLILDQGAMTATWTKANAVAAAQVFLPQGVSCVLSDTEITPTDPTKWPEHRVLKWETGTARTILNSVLLLEVRKKDETAPSLVTAPVSTNDPDEVVAFSITDGTNDKYLYVSGPRLEKNILEVYFQGDTLEVTCNEMLLRWSSGSSSFNAITAGSMSNGEVFEDGYLVGSLQSDSLATMSFSASGVSVWTASGHTPTYFVGPVVPAAASINGTTTAVAMAEYPHLGTSVFPAGEGRSPKNAYFVSLGDTVNAYRSEVTLKDWAGNPISGWPKERLALSIANCADTSSMNQPVADSDAHGRVVWASGLDTGGSCQGSRPNVTISVDYGDGSGFHKLRVYNSVSSPDEDGDGDVDAVDCGTFWQAYLGHVLYRADLNGDGVIDIKDYNLFVAHRNAP